jgi:D-alanyl-D-alanine dipeptidase
MQCKFYALVTLSLLPFGLRAQPVRELPETLALSSQLVVVTTKDWAATEGVLRRFERTEYAWEQVGPAIPVMVGRNGLGWGRGLVDPPNSSDPQKVEGDGRSPAGLFYLPYAFGYAAADQVPQIKLQYVQCTASAECVEDTNSPFYNIIKDRASLAKTDWQKSEKMRRSDDKYKLGLFIAHNTATPKPEAGACVFMESWDEPGHPTSGNTAMSMGSLESLLGWLADRSKPVLVQLPQEQYQKEQRFWRLPPIQF